MEHRMHVGHARDVPSERLIESLCILPGEAMRGGMWEARWILHGGYSVRQVVQRQVALRTWNIPLMLVTLETSQASGWLKAFADCRARQGVARSGR